jgi:hypothetical protein
LVASDLLAWPGNGLEREGRTINTTRTTGCGHSEVNVALARRHVYRHIEQQSERTHNAFSTGVAIYVARSTIEPETDVEVSTCQTIRLKIEWGYEVQGGDTTIRFGT